MAACLPIFAAMATWHTVAKAYFCKRVVCIGVESSGTTTLAQQLAKHYSTAWVPEYGRSYWEGRQYTPDAEGGWDTAEFVAIVRTAASHVTPAYSRARPRMMP